LRRINLVIISILVLVSLLASQQEARCGSGRSNLYSILIEKEEVKVYVEGITNSSDAEKVEAAALKEALEDALVSRIALNLKPVSSWRTADIIVKCDIVEVLWRDKDPIDMIYGAPSLVVDILTTKHYARMQAVFTVIDADTGEELWSERIQATVTSEKITPESSIAILNEKIVEGFTRKALSKRKDKKKNRSGLM